MEKYTPARHLAGICLPTIPSNRPADTPRRLGGLVEEA